MLDDIQTIIKYRDWSMLVYYLFSTATIGLFLLILSPIWLPIVIGILLTEIIRGLWEKILEPIVGWLVYPVGFVFDMHQTWREITADRFQKKHKLGKYS